MKTDEVMIGDLLYWDAEGKKYPYPITAEDFANGDVSDLTPIPLTNDILETVGFKKIINDYGRVYYELGLNEYNNKLFLYNNSIVIDFEGNDIYLCDCEYVHELQHVLKICKIEKHFLL